MNKKKPARKPRSDFLSVVPVTSREEPGTTSRQINLRSAMSIELLRNKSKIQKLLERNKRLEAAINALGKIK